jgi:hypothetical protein
MISASRAPAERLAGDVPVEPAAAPGRAHGAGLEAGGVDPPAVEDEGHGEGGEIGGKRPVVRKPAEGHAGRVRPAERLQRADVDIERILQELDERIPGGRVAEIILPEGQAAGIGRAHTPVEPKPPAPREVSLASAISTTRAWLTDAISIWAMRMPRVTAKSSSPRLASSTFTSPR